MGISGGQREHTPSYCNPGIRRLGPHPPMCHPEEVRSTSRSVDRRDPLVSVPIFSFIMERHALFPTTRMPGSGQQRHLE